MYRQRRRLPTLELAAGTCWLLAAAAAVGQGSYSGITPVNQPIEVPSLAPASAAQGPETFVSFIDSALPWSRAQMRFEAAYGNQRPTRVEFWQPMSGPFSGRGPTFPETRVDWQDLTSYVEVAWFGRRFSTFLEMPYRWVNPQINDNVDGFGDVNLGCKWAFWAVPNWTTTLQLRALVPTAAERSLGTKHFSFEPALLLNYRPVDLLTLEGELRYWVPVGGTKYAGDFVRYGLGLVYGDRQPEDFWLTPVVECVGWTVLHGEALVAQSATSFGLENSAGDTIVNVMFGLRCGFGTRMDLYGGYGRALTGPTWYKDIWRLEYRFFF